LGVLRIEAAADGTGRNAAILRSQVQIAQRRGKPFRLRRTQASRNSIRPPPREHHDEGSMSGTDDLVGDSAVRKASVEFIGHCHSERHHRGLDEALI
jgi:hypothetical protein